MAAAPAVAARKLRRETVLAGTDGCDSAGVLAERELLFDTGFS
jgi:hypothetical protein